MECLNCGAWMKRIIDPTNGKIYWHCPVCECVEDTPYLAPNPTNSWEVE